MMRRSSFARERSGPRSSCATFRNTGRGWPGCSWVHKDDHFYLTLPGLAPITDRNLLFGSAEKDGHYEGQKWVEARTIKAAMDSAVGILSFNWAGDGPNNPDFRWVWDKYRYRNWKPL